MSLSESPTASAHEIRFLAWQEKNRRSDQLTEKRVKIAFAVIVVVLLLVILYSWRQTKAPSKGTQPIVAIHRHLSWRPKIVSYRLAVHIGAEST